MENQISSILNYMDQSFSIFIWVLTFAFFLVISLLMVGKIFGKLNISYKYSYGGYSVLIISLCLAIAETYGLYYWLTH